MIEYVVLNYLSAWLLNNAGIEGFYPAFQCYFSEDYNSNDKIQMVRTYMRAFWGPEDLLFGLWGPPQDHLRVTYTFLRHLLRIFRTFCGHFGLRGHFEDFEDFPKAFRGHLRTFWGHSRTLSWSRSRCHSVSPPPRIWPLLGASYAKRIPPPPSA